MATESTESPTAPFGIRLALLVLLPLLALALYLDGQDYDPDRVQLRPRESAATPGAGLLPDAIAGLRPFGQPRHFTKDNLYEYINGHAEYFIGAGFNGLTVGEYGPAGADQPALVINLYDLGGAMNAFGVLVDEAGGQEPVELGEMGFRNTQGISFIHGPYFVQISLFDPGLSGLDAGRAMATRLQEQVRAPGLAFRFPDLGQVTATRFVKADYRGLGFLHDVVERGFERNGEEIQAFRVSGTEQVIRELVGAFETFFREDEMPYQRETRDGLTFYRVDDPYEGEWFFAPLPGQLIGVYAPLDEALAAAMAEYSRQ